MTGISVIIRCKNEEKALGRCLATIFTQQTDVSFEVIVVDSGSTDHTLTIAREYPVRLFEIPPESFSFGFALNHGIERADGAIIVNISAHCIPVHNTWLSEITGPVREGRADAVYGRQVPVKGVNPFEEVSLDRHFPGTEKSGGRVAFSNANCSFLRKMWEVVRFDEALPSWEDFLWYLLLKDRYRFHYCPEAAVYHSHPFSVDSVTRRSYNDGRAFRMMKEKYDIDLIGKDYPTILAKGRLFMEDVKNHMSFFVHNGYASRIFLTPVVRLLAFKAYRDGYKSVKQKPL